MESNAAFVSPVKTYVLRRGRMTDTQKTDYAALLSEHTIAFSNEHIDFVRVFGNANPVVMEIGFGMGSATALIAEQNPGINYLAIEVHTPGVARLLGEIRRRGITNIRIIEHDALEVCAAMLEVNCLSGVHVFFPDPWQKKRHYKRRLMVTPRASLIVSRLVPGGYFYFITDWEQYAHASLDVLTEIPCLINKYSGFAPKQDWRPETKFEVRGKKEARGIWELFFVKTA